MRTIIIKKLQEKEKNYNILNKELKKYNDSIKIDGEKLYILDNILRIDNHYLYKVIYHYKKRTAIHVELYFKIAEERYIILLPYEYENIILSNKKEILKSIDYKKHFEREWIR